MNKSRPLTLARHAAARALMLTLAVAAPLAAAQAADAWPTQPLKAIVPFGPGSSPDQVARIVGEKAGAILGQTIVIENKPGASGNIGTFAIANAKPDGYTFGVSITGPLVNNTLLFDKARALAERHNRGFANLEQVVDATYRAMVAAFIANEQTYFATMKDVGDTHE